MHDNDPCPFCGEPDYTRRTSTGEPCCRWDHEALEAVEALKAADVEHDDAWWDEAMALAGVMR